MLLQYGIELVLHGLNMVLIKINYHSAVNLVDICISLIDGLDLIVDFMQDLD